MAPRKHKPRVVRKPKPKLCFNCGDPSVYSITSRGLPQTHFLCMELPCWKAYDSKREQATQKKGTAK